MQNYVPLTVGIWQQANSNVILLTALFIALVTILMVGLHSRWLDDFRRHSGLASRLLLVGLIGSFLGLNLLALLAEVRLYNQSVEALEHLSDFFRIAPLATTPIVVCHLLIDLALLALAIARLFFSPHRSPSAQE